MSVQITSNRVRFAVDSVFGLQLAAITDKLTGLPLRFWQSSDLQFEVGLFNNGTIVDSIANIAKITLELKAPENLLGLALYSGDVLVGAMATPSLVNWNAGTDQHAVFAVTKAQSNIELVGQKERPLMLFVWLTDTTGTPKRIPLCQTLIYLTDSGFGDIGSITIQPPGAQMVGGRLQILNPDDGTYTTWVTKVLGGVKTLAPE